MEQMILLQSTEIKKIISDEVKHAIQEALKDVNLSNDNLEILQISDVCKLLKKSRPTIISWTEKGILRRHTVNGSVFYIKSQVLEAITNSEKA